MNTEIDLLNQASFEIKRLRSQNEMTSARLEMFDKCMLLLHTAPSYQSQSMSPDLVWQIEKHIAVMQSENKSTEPAKESI